MFGLNYFFMGFLTLWNPSVEINKNGLDEFIGRSLGKVGPLGQAVDHRRWQLTLAEGDVVVKRSKGRSGIGSMQPSLTHRSIKKNTAVRIA